jgi:DNA (cytosine-5)-methyltransferase 1
MSLGFEQGGFEIKGAYDFDPINVEYHRKNFPRTPTIEADVSKLKADRIRSELNLGQRELDVLFGGPPCQGFSEIGQRSRDDSRSRLIYDFARLARELQPRYFVVENVRGLLYGYSRPILESFLKRVKKAGYRIVEPVKVLDASHYGVPQKRQRVFILGYREGQMAPTYPDPTHGHAEALSCPTVSDAIGDLPDLTSCDSFLTTDLFDGTLGPGSPYARMLRGDLEDKGNRSYPRTKGKSFGGFLKTGHSAETVKRFDATLQGTSEEISRCYRLSLDRQAYTLRAGTGPKHGSFTAARPIHPVEPRCITTREAARLHSFPDWFEFHPTKWHGFRQVGNSVPPLLARAVARVVRVAAGF